MLLAHRYLLVSEMPSFPVPPKTNQNFRVRTIAAEIRHDVTAFRDCHQRFQECLEYRNPQNNSSLSELTENYLLDFELAAKRALSSNVNRYRLFQLRYLQGANRQDCCKLLGLQLFCYASEIIQIESVVGRALVERGLFPLTSYFNPAELKLHRIAA